MSDNNMLEVKVVHLGLDRSSNTPVVILQEKDGERVLPIWIGPSEASAIAMELAGVKFSRPLTHDLVKQVVLGLGGQLQRISITRVQENTYYAEMEIRQGENVVKVDARPSDSIAVALRFGAPIFTQEDLLGVSSIDLVEPAPGESESLDADSLKSYLEKLDPEDFGKFVP
jgi:bifunctional DNase/RNase